MANSKSEIRKAEKVVDEIRAIRRRLWQDASCDVDAFLKQLNQDVPWKVEKKAIVKKKKAKSKGAKPLRSKMRSR